MRVGVADTTFSRVNMGAIAIDELKKLTCDGVLSPKILPIAINGSPE